MILRIDKFLADCGEGTRSEVKKMIKSGKVYIDGNRVTSHAVKVDTDKSFVTIGERKIEYERYRYIMMNKPKGVISAVKDASQRTVMQLIKKEDLKKGMFPMGRLDVDTEGLIIITNNGKLAHETLTPKKHVMKKYYAEVCGRLTEKEVSVFKDGIILSGVKTKSAKLEIISSGDISKVYVEISEGKFHQIKRMFQKVGSEVVYLKRIKFGDITLDENLAEGEYRFLNESEIEILSKYADV